MFNPGELWKKRLNAHIKETSRYLRFMFNDHLAFAMLFFIAVFAYYYQQWLQDIPANFPADWIMAIVLGAVTTYSPVRTLLQEADLVFLLPVEQKLRIYFRNSMIYSFIIQIYVLVFVLAAFSPLYLAVYTERGSSTLFYLFLLLLVYKGWNMIASWWMLKLRDSMTRYIDHGIRFFLTVMTIFFFFQKDAFWYVSMTTVMFFGILLFDYYFAGRQKIILWDLLIEKEQARMQSFYRLANLFTDVPHVRPKVNKRTFLVSALTKYIPHKQDSTFSYLYGMTLIRSSDYIGLYIRLLLLAIFFMLWVENLWLKYVFGLLFMYISGFQLLTLWHHHRTVIWLDLYPIDESIRQQALFKMILKLQSLKGMMLSIVLYFAEGILHLLIFLVLSGLSITVSFTYWKKRHMGSSLNNR